MTSLIFQKKSFVLAIILLLSVAGLLAYKSMPRAEDPPYKVREAQIITSWPGASPKRVEDLITDKIEKHVQKLPEVKTIESVSKTGLSIVKVKLRQDCKEILPIWTKVRQKVEDAERELPPTAMKPFVQDDYGDVFGIVIGVVGDGFDLNTLEPIAKKLKADLMELPDVAKIELLGTQEERIFIDYKNEKLEKLGLSPDYLHFLLATRNIVQSGGTLYSGIEQVTLEPTGNFEDLEAIKNTVIPLPQSSHLLYLSDIAEVTRGVISPPSSLMRVNGHPSLGLAVSMRERGDALTLGKQVRQILRRYQETHPIGTQFEEVVFQPDRVNYKIQEFAGNLGQAIFIVCLVMLFFLGVRIGLIIASAIPIVILITFFILPLFGISLNQVTFASLIIALGMLVDNGIVIAESMAVLIQEKGKKPLEAAFIAAKELKVSLLISTLTTCAAFLPFYFAQSATGEYVSSVFIIVSVVLLVSWLIAFTLTSMMCVKFIPSTPKRLFNPRLPLQTYRRLLRWTLMHRMRFCIILGGLFAVSLWGYTAIPKIFYPPSNHLLFTAEIELPVGSSIWRTEQALSEIEHFVEENLHTNGEVLSWVSYIGNGGPRYRLQHEPEPPNSHYALMLFTVKDYAALTLATEKLDQYLFENHPSIRPKVRRLQEGVPIKNPIELRLSREHKHLKTALKELPGTKNVDDNWGLETKKIVIAVDETRASRAHITHADVASSLESAVSGRILSLYREGDTLIPIVLRSQVARDFHLIESETFNVFSTASPNNVPLFQVATPHLDWEAPARFRYNRQEMLTLVSDLNKGFTAHALEKAIRNHPEIAKVNYELGGEHEASTEAEHSIFVHLPLTLILIVLLLLAQFNSWKHTTLILMTIPLSFIGVILGLLIGHSYFGIMTILGVISLSGIVVNNGVLLIEQIQLMQKQEQSLSQHDAIIEAACSRFRPIFLTTLTTVTGLIPLWIGGGPLWEPLAITLFFGLLTGAILTLFVLPLFYTIFSNSMHSMHKEKAFS
ncbi:efflux RND transporter permease subunit [Simkania negevensis]|uniref:AcrB/AcrD/AcrF family protein n=1 Tax=Simkania negevensis (strain ATCC VR-1471 / DSM 27360 / Z) TaxID=331113 RepID=F8L6I7_SIMNZ|nr:efflux RND transporter permease subunit [Simkania negevensis]CCB88326.1 acrB/AcrD/AcrF family protein [Simkania negevensis Z]